MQYYNRVFLLLEFLSIGQKLHKLIYIYANLDILLIYLCELSTPTQLVLRKELPLCPVIIILFSVSKKSEANFCPYMKKSAINTLAYFGESILLDFFCFVQLLIFKIPRLLINKKRLPWGTEFTEIFTSFPNVSFLIQFKTLTNHATKKFSNLCKNI